MPRILAATRDGLHAFDEGGHEGAVEHEGRPVTAIVRAGPQLWAIVDRSEVWHAPDVEWHHVATLDGHVAMKDLLQHFRINGGFYFTFSYGEKECR